MIGIVAGHGGSDHGCHSEDGELIESCLTMHVAAEACRLLGGKAYMVRDVDVDLRHVECRDIAQRNNCTACVVLHFDSDPQRPHRRGCAYFYRHDDQTGRILGVHVCNAVGGDWRGWEMPSPDWPNPSNVTGSYAPMPCALVELAFLSNPTDCAKLKRKGGLDDLGARVAQGIESYLKGLTP